jgi:hypothetical protein
VSIPTMLTVHYPHDHYYRVHHIAGAGIRRRCFGHRRGTLVPMSDLIRLASNSHNYLVIYDKHTEEPLYLYRSKRLASAGQRIVLHAHDRGCTFPGRTVAGYGCQFHHAEFDWAEGGQHHRRGPGLRTTQPPGQTEITMTEPPTACGAQAVGGSANAPDHRALCLTTPRCSPPRRPPRGCRRA